MSGRHRKPTHTGLRLARMGALTVMAMTPLAMTGSALAAPSDSDLDPSSSADPDSSGWTDDADRRDPGDRSDGSHRSDRSDRGDDETADPAALHSFDWRDSASPRSTHRGSTTPTRSPTTADAAAPTASAASLAKWDKLAECESTRNWSANTGSYRGGLQLSDATWRRYGGHQYAASADRASRAQQIAVAEKVRQAQGWNAWPGCSRKLGYS